VRRYRQFALAAGLTAFVVVTGGAGSQANAHPRTGTEPVAVSGPSPFAPGCNGAPQTGTNYPNTSVEPQLAVNPVDPHNIVAGYQQDRWSNGASNSDMVSVTHDGGHTWTPMVLPHITRCAGGNADNGGDYERATDPWVSFSPDGTLYYVSQQFNNSNPGNGMAVSRSADGGDTWTDPVSLIKDEQQGVLNDKVSITADPTDSRYVYATWDRVSSPPPDPSAATATDGNGYRGPTLLSSTADHGATWTTRTIFDPGVGNQTLGNQIVVLPHGTLVDMFSLIVNLPQPGAQPGTSIALIHSGDQGATWSEPVIVSDVQDSPVTDPNTGAAVRTGDSIPTVAADRQSGALYTAWQDNRFNGGGHDDVVLSRSTDGGLTWSAPAVVSQDPSTQAFTPTVQVGVDGTVAVSYYDFRDLAPGNTATLPTNYWVVTSRDGGVTWSEEHIAGPFDLLSAPDSEGLFLGDYTGLAAVGNSFRPLFSATTDGRTGVFTSTVNATPPNDSL
jgi:hypothetical protein